MSVTVYANLVRFGWQDDSLQRAMDTPDGCIASTCPTLKTQGFDEANKCVLERQISEDVDGWLERLPGISM